MAKDTYYFQHDYNARNDDKILEIRAEFGLAGYGLFWCIIETMNENEDGTIKPSLIAGLSLGYGCTKEQLLSMLEFCVKITILYKYENGSYYSNRVIKHKSFRQTLAENGRAGALKKWENTRQAMAGLSQGNSDPNAKERKGKERKVFVAPTAKQVADYFIENGYTQESAIKAFNYYHEANWIDSQGKKVKSWKQKMQGVWFKPENKIQSSKRTISSFI